MRHPYRHVGAGFSAALRLIYRAWRQPAPVPLNLQQRLAMLPLTGAPLADSVRIRWNTHQVPMIEARSDTDLMVALGVVHNHLRMGQIEMMRRISQARLSEMLGPWALSIDQSLVSLDLARAVPTILAEMPVADKCLAEAFVAGLNHSLLATTCRPVEADIFGMELKPWTLAEWLQLSRLAAVDISWLVWQQLWPLRKSLGAKKWQSLWPRIADNGLPAAGVLDAPSVLVRSLSGLLRSGSNAVAVAATHSQQQAPLLAADPHLPLHAPSAWLLAGWRSPSFHCVGMMMPGLPFMLLGRNPDIAWGGTSLHAQSSDLYDVSDLAAQDFSHHQHRIRLPNGRHAVIDWRSCVHGPVVSDGRLWSSPTPVALRWVGHQPSQELSAMLGIARARDIRGFKAALHSYAVSGANMICCDRLGDVAHIVAARLPNRGPELPPDMVLKPSDNQHWQRMLGVAERPVQINPAAGFVVSANQPPPMAGPAIGYFFSPPDRAERWSQLLRSAVALTADQLKMMQRDVFAQQSFSLCQDWLAVLSKYPAGAKSSAVQTILADWDGCYTADSEGALAFELVQNHLLRSVRSKRERRAAQAVWMQQCWLAQDLAQLSEPVLAQRLRRALRWADQRWHRYQRWGQAHRLQLRHPLAWLPRWARYSQPPEIMAEGSQATLYKSGHGPVTGRHRASFGSCARQVCDLAELDANDFVLLGGQDGWLGSDTCYDQIRLWQQGEYMRMPLTAAAVKLAYPYCTLLQPGTAS